ncbi:MAG: methylmalonyl Co-A mutase-associated GTPase MeaB [Candidatus Nanopelagicales bacterium]
MSAEAPSGDWRDLVARAREGEPRAVARLISWVEDGSPSLPEVMAALSGSVPPAYVIGVTGAPGVGKSTTTSALVDAYRARGLRVGVLAVDPTSPFTGGALLGDRIRMQHHATDEGVFIRSMASRGHLGGIAAGTPQAIRILEAAGCAIVIVETVGVGQSEVEVAGAADATVVLLAPGMGDGIQAAKAGILEVGDILCVNKADRDGADATVREVRHMLSMGSAGSGWTPVVVTSVASRGEVADLVAALDARQAWLREDDHLRDRRRRRAAEEVLAIAAGRVRGELAGRLTDDLTDAVASGSMDPYSAAARLLADDRMGS